MKVFRLLLLAIFSLLIDASALTKGMSLAEVEAELGAPVSRMAAGSREVLLYPGNQKLEFIDGILQGTNGVMLPTKTGSLQPNFADTPTPQTAAPLLETKLELPVMRDQQTITESTQGQLELADIGEGYEYGKIMQDLTAELEDLGNNRNTARRSEATNQLLRVLIGFVVELIITIFILKLSFQLCGFPNLWHQVCLLSGLVALAGAVVAFLLDAGLFNPIRIGLSFILLLGLIKMVTDVREWATAIKIALTARLISIGFMWLALASAMVLFGI